MQVVKCPKHAELVFFKETDTHTLFKCPECDYVDYPGVVHGDLPEKYMKLQAEKQDLWKSLKIHVKALIRLQDKNKRLKEAADAGYELSTWAASIKWNHREKNTTSWLEGLKEQILKVQTLKG